MKGALIAAILTAEVEVAAGVGAEATKEENIDVWIHVSVGLALFSVHNVCIPWLS
jgi:hypothetical protein